MFCFLLVVHISRKLESFILPFLSIFISKLSLHGWPLRSIGQVPLIIQRSFFCSVMVMLTSVTSFLSFTKLMAMCWASSSSIMVFRLLVFVVDFGLHVR